MRYANPADTPPDMVKLKRTQRRLGYALATAVLVVLAAYVLIAMRPACVRW